MDKLEIAQFLIVKCGQFHLNSKMEYLYYCWSTKKYFTNILGQNNFQIVRPNWNFGSQYVILRIKDLKF